MRSDLLKQHILRVAEGRLDAGESLTFARDLERIETEFYDVKYPDLKGRSLIPLGSGLGPADKINTWRQFDRHGEAREGGMKSDDVPLVTLDGVENYSTVVPITVGFEYDIQEIREAAKLGRPLDSALAMAARKAVEEKIERMCAIGSVQVAQNKIYGLLNQPNVPVIGVTADSSTTSGFTPLATGAANSNAVLTWGPDAGGFTKTPKEIIRDLNNWRNQVIKNTNGVEQPGDLLLDLKSYTYIDTTQVNDADSAIFTQGTIKQYIMSNLAWLKSIDWWLGCDASLTGTGPGTHGSTSKSRALLYTKAPGNMKMFIPQEFETFPVQLINYKMRTLCHARFGGVVMYYPRSAVYIDGLQA